MPVERVVAITGSAGSLPVAKRILGSSHPDGRTSVFLCYHRAGETQFDWRPYVDGYGAHPARDGEPVRPDVVYYPERSLTMYVSQGRLRTQDGPERPRPSLDRLLASLAHEYGPRVHAFLLSGLGHDALEGLLAVRQAGGMVVVQHPDSAAFGTLPERAIAAGLADHILDLHELVAVASRLASGDDLPAFAPPRAD